MKRKLLLILVPAVSLVVAACKDKPVSVSAPTVATVAPKTVTGHGVAPLENNDDHPQAGKRVTADILKTMKLADYPDKTIGQAFDGYKYFTSRSWRETRLQNKKIYIDFEGLQKPGILSAGTQVYSEGVDIKFVIQPDGSFYVAMASKVKIMSDGMRYETPLAATKPVLDAVYANSPIVE